MPKWRIGERNEGNARNGMGMWEISVILWGIWVDMRRISVEIQGIMVKMINNK